MSKCSADVCARLTKAKTKAKRARRERGSEKFSRSLCLFFRWKLATSCNIIASKSFYSEDDKHLLINVFSGALNYLEPREQEDLFVN